MIQESRARQERSGWERSLFAATEFYADIEGMPGDPAVDRALAELAFHSKWVRLLGSYPQARPRSL